MQDANQPPDETAGNAGSASDAGNAGNTGNAGTRRRVTLDKARHAARAAKFATADQPHRPWEQFDPNEKPDLKHRFSVALNDYDIALIHEVQGWRKLGSKNQTIVQLLREAALAEVRRRERRAG